MQNKKLEEKIQILENELSNIKAREQSKRAKLNTLFKYSVMTALLSGSLYGFAAVIASLHIFSDGEVISAQKINENFQYLENKINGVSGGGPTPVNIPNHDNISLTPADMGKLFVVQQTAFFDLPDIHTVQPGTTYKISISGLGQVRLRPFGTDVLEGQNKDYYFHTDSSAYREILSTGSNWIVSIASGSSGFYQLTAAEVFTGTCDGKTSTSSNCYLNSSATGLAYMLRDNYLYEYFHFSPNFVWERKADYKYLINDPNSVLTGIHLTKNSALINYASTIDSIGGVKFVVINNSYYNPNLKNLTYHDSSIYSHNNGAADDNFLNTEIFSKLENNGWYNGTNCQNLLGSDWRLITGAEATTVGNVGFDYWTAAITANSGEYLYHMEGTGLATSSDPDYAYLGLVCVYDP